MPFDLRTFGRPQKDEWPVLLLNDVGLEFTRADFPPYIGASGADGYEVFTSAESPEHAAYLALVKAAYPDVVAGAGSVPAMREVPTTCGGEISAMHCNTMTTYPRTDMVLQLANHWTYSDHEDKARKALAVLPEMLAQIPAKERCAPFADSADLYLRMGDRHAALQAIKAGFAAADEELKSEETRYQTSTSQLVRPSAVLYEQLISAGVNADHEYLIRQARSLPNLALRCFTTADIARALLGVPERRTLTAFPGGSYTGTVGFGSYTAF